MLFVKDPSRDSRRKKLVDILKINDVHAFHGHSIKMLQDDKHVKDKFIIHENSYI